MTTNIERLGKAIKELALLQWRENKVGIALLVAFVVAAVVFAVLS